MEEVFPEIGRTLSKFRNFCKRHFNSVSELFVRLNDSGEAASGEVSFLTLRTACKRLADSMFRLTDLQQLISGVVEPIQVGMFCRRFSLSVLFFMVWDLSNFDKIVKK